MSTGYSVVVGRERPAEALVSYAKKDGTPTGTDQLKRYISVGKHLLANVCSVWGRRVIDGKSTIDGNPINFDTKGYSGEIEFLKYGDPQGHLITIRYLKKSRSLDVEYQDNILKLKIDTEKGADGSAQVELDAGENRYDVKKDALFVQYLKVHPQNRDSVSKNPEPEIKGYTFFEVSDDNVQTASIDQAEKSLDAGFIVKEASKKSSDLKTLLLIMGEREELKEVDSLSKDKQIYDALLKFAISKPNDFQSLLGNYKKSFSDAVEWAKSHNALDLTKDGHVALIVENKKELLFTDIPAKGNNMVDWIMSNCVDSEVYKKVNNFITLTQKLK